MGKRKKTHEFSDQFGEYRSQDREEHMGGPGRGAGGGAMRGGGGAGGGRRGANVNFQRQLPKFLQPYAHMLGGGGGEDGAVMEGGSDDEAPPPAPGTEKKRPGYGGGDSDGDDDDGDEEAIQRALQENPELAQELGERVTKKIEAMAAKEAGNKAFGAKKYEEAVEHFTKAIEMDPSSEVFLSNRSAAYAALGRFQLALDDAAAVARLKPRWAKGHARRGAALMGLKRFGEARQAYETALRIEPDDQALVRGRDRANAMELQQMRENKHTFAAKRAKTDAAPPPGSGKDVGGDGKGGSSTGTGAGAGSRGDPGGSSGGGASGGGGSGGGGGGAGNMARPPIKAAKKDKRLLSFGEEEEEDGG